MILHFPPQQTGFATSQSFWISSVLLTGTMLPADTDGPWRSTSGTFLQSGECKSSHYREQPWAIPKGKNVPNFVTQWHKFGLWIIFFDCKLLWLFKYIICSIFLKRTLMQMFNPFLVQVSVSNCTLTWKDIKRAYQNTRNEDASKRLVWRSQTVLICRLKTFTYRHTNMKLLRKLLLVRFIRLWSSSAPLVHESPSLATNHQRLFVTNCQSQALILSVPSITKAHP